MTEHAFEQAPAQRATLLVVEDDPETSALYQDLFKIEGYHTIVVPSGERALEVLRQRSVDLILLDIMLPDGSGYDLYDQLRCNIDEQVPIIMVSALSQPKNVAQGFQLGVDDYLRKPFATEELVARVEHLLLRRDNTIKVLDENLLLRDRLDQVLADVKLLQQANEAEVLLRRELLHNVATHMQALCGIIDAEMRKLSPSAERDTVQRIRSRVYGAALVYQTSEALTEDPVELGALIRTIAKALKSMYRPWRRVLIEVTGGEAPLSNQLAAPLAMVVNELVTNCFKHAFPDNSFGKIEVTYGIDAHTFRLAVADNGVGFDTTKPTTGAGCSAITRLIQGIEGRVTWHSTPDGTRVDVQVPLART